jgi:hypothetical protein
MGKILWLIAKAQWDRTIAIGLALLAVLVLVVGWIGVASTSYPAEQLPYIISGGIFGVVLMGAAATLWLSADMRDEWRKLDEISENFRNGAPPEPVESPPPVATTNSAGSRKRTRVAAEGERLGAT